MATYYKAIILFLLISCDETNVSSPNAAKEYDLDQDTVIPSVIYDGDTFAFTDPEFGFQVVRIIDVDAFETSVNDRIFRQAERHNISIDSCLILGEKAKEFAFANIFQKPVFIRKGSRNKDIYDRLLRYVEFDGKKYDSSLKVMNLDTGL